MKIRTIALGTAVIASVAAASCGNRNAVTIRKLGSAETGADRSVSLTPSKAETTGGVLRSSPLEIVAFTTEFRFSVSDARDSSDQCDGKRPGGDGLAFVLLGNDPKQLGSGGSGLGYQGLTNSLAVEFDIACSSGNGDPATPHIAIDIDGSVNHGAGSVAKPVVIVDPRSGTSFDDAAVWTAWIDYREGVMSVRVARDGKRPEQPSLSTKVPATLIESHKLWPGFTAANGKGASKQSIIGWKSEWVMVPRPSTPPGPPPQPFKEQLIGAPF